MLESILWWGLIAGFIHFVIIGALYTNPLSTRIYNEAQENPALKVWKNQKEYLLKMFAGTQIEIYILSGAYLYLRNLFPEPASFKTAFILAAIFSALRVYPRFWNMWIQTVYPIKLLLLEFTNGIIGTFIVVFSLWILPI